MSFYIEIENANEDAPGPKTFLVLSFNAASKLVKGSGFFTNGVYESVPKVTCVKVSSDTQNYDIKIPVGYEEFKQKLIEAQKTNTIPSFSKI
jgi:hypothetical protein